MTISGASASDGPQLGPRPSPNAEGEARAFGAMLGGLDASIAEQPAGLDSGGEEPHATGKKDSLAVGEDAARSGLASAGLVPVNPWIATQFGPERTADVLIAAANGGMARGAAVQGARQDLASGSLTDLARGTLTPAELAAGALKQPISGDGAARSGSGLTGVGPTWVSAILAGSLSDTSFGDGRIAGPADAANTARAAAASLTPDAITLRDTDKAALPGTGSAQTWQGEPSSAAAVVGDEPAAQPAGRLGGNDLPGPTEPAQAFGSLANAAQPAAGSGRSAEALARTGMAVSSPGADGDLQSVGSTASDDESTAQALSARSSPGGDTAGAGGDTGDSPGDGADGGNGDAGIDRLAMTAARAAGDDPASAGGEFAAGLEGEIRLAGSQAEAGGALGAAARIPYQIAERIEKAFRTGDDRLVVELHPAELGGVEIRLHTGADGALVAELIVERPETLVEMQRDLRDLAQRLEDAGITLDEDGLQLSLRQEGGSGQGFARDTADRRNERAAMANGPVREAAGETVLIPQASRSGDRLLDLIL